MSHDRPAAEGIAPGHFTGPPVATGHVAPCPRRIRARSDEGWSVDTVAAFYVWENPYYPQYAVPRSGLPGALLDRARPAPDDPRLRGHVVLGFDTAEQWFEEDEQVHGHPRSPYVRVDALRSQRPVTVLVSAETGSGSGSPHVLASSPDCVIVFETGLPPRYYLDPATVDWSAMTPTDTVTRCPYKGVARDWWSLGERADVAWSYQSATLSLQPIAGLVCFDDTQVEVQVG